MAGEPADFAGLLRQLRDDAGLTQEELAQRARLGVTTVSELERGRHLTCQPQTARRLADGLGLSGEARDVFVAIARGLAPIASMAATRTADAAVQTGISASLPGLAGTPLAIGPRPVPRELPADVSAFTGRADELARLDALLPAVQADGDSQAGPVVISAVAGTAGVGKTALAVRWAHRVAALFPDGQLYINLRGYDHSEPVPAGEALAYFLRALGVMDADIPVQEAERAARYRSVVAGKRLLLLLDNAATTDQIRPLLPGTGTVMVVVTSRDSLAGLIARNGAQRLELDALPAADAVALLRTLIGSRVDADPPAARALVGLCACLPLALRVAAELAISRPHTALAEFVAELSSLPERLARLDAGEDSPYTTANVFSWSYRHLSPGAARMFRLLGEHPGPGFDHYAAAALAATSVTQAAQQLEVLARAHLIQPAGKARYGMHDLLRAYAAEQAVAVDGEEARRDALLRLFDYYLAASAAAMDSYAPAERHDRPARPAIATPVPDLGDRTGAREWLDAELATLTAVTVHTAANGWPGHATRLAATLHRYLDGGHYGEGIAIHTHALTAARHSGDQAGLARALIRLAGLHSRQGEYQQAVGCNQQALVVARDMSDRRLESRALSNLAVIYSRQSRYREALYLYEQALAIDREQGDQLREVVQLGNLGLVHFRQGRYEQAADHQQQALALFGTLGDQLGEANTLTNLGEVRYRQGLCLQAVKCQQRALAMAREIGDRRIEAWALTSLGEICHRQGSYDTAATHHQRALELFRQIGDREGEASALNGTGESLLAIGLLDQAHSRHTAALGLTDRTGDRYQHARALTRLGEISHQQCRHDDAAERYRQALALYQEIGDPSGEADVLNRTGESLLSTGQPAQAHAAHTAALTLARTTGDRYQEARAHRGLAAACRAVGQLSQASQHQQDALGIYAGLAVPEAAQLRV